MDTAIYFAVLVEKETVEYDAVMGAWRDLPIDSGGAA